MVQALRWKVQVRCLGSGAQSGLSTGHPNKHAVSKLFAQPLHQEQDGPDLLTQWLGTKLWATASCF